MLIISMLPMQAVSEDGTSMVGAGHESQEASDPALQSLGRYGRTAQASTPGQCGGAGPQAGLDGIRGHQACLSAVLHAKPHRAVCSVLQQVRCCMSPR